MAPHSPKDEARAGQGQKRRTKPPESRRCMEGCTGASRSYRDAIAKVAPGLADEIRGIAEGAAVAETVILALNARTEILPPTVKLCGSMIVQ